MELDDLIHIFSTNVTLLERCNQEWTSILNVMEGDSEEKIAEEREYLQAIEGREGSDCKFDSAYDLRNATLQKSSWEDKNPIKVKLPKLDLPIFDGNILCWQEFWDIFSTSVHKQNIPNVTKFNYLKNSLRAAAATALSGISVTNDNYEMVIGMLKDKFGKTEDIIAALYSRLQHLPQVIN